MAQYQVVRVDKLDNVLVLSPERYDPRRRSVESGGLRLSEVVEVIKEQVKPNVENGSERYLILDTNHAWNGCILIDSIQERTKDKLGSIKKIVHSGDVIVSRLRPYLRQVAFIDEKVATGLYTVVCSTEFFVLRSKNGKSIAFLVPFLLSDSIQKIFSASQEGGHHPRFNQATLDSLVIPESIVSKRDEISEMVIKAVDSFRLGSDMMHCLVENNLESGKDSHK